MEYKLHNPSDPYTFIAEDLETAALTVFALSTAYGAESKDRGERVPVFVFGGAEEWYQEQFGRTMDEGIKKKKEAMADALSSFMLGDFEDRRKYNAALAAITDPEKKKEFIEAWQDGRSSFSDIGGYAHRLGEKLREQQKEQEEKQIC